MFANLQTSAPVYTSGALFIAAGIITIFLPFESRGKASLWFRVCIANQYTAFPSVLQSTFHWFFKWQPRIWLAYPRSRLLLRTIERVTHSKGCCLPRQTSAVISACWNQASTRTKYVRIQSRHTACGKLTSQASFTVFRWKRFVLARTLSSDQSGITYTQLWERIFTAMQPVHEDAVGRYEWCYELTMPLVESKKVLTVMRTFVYEDLALVSLYIMKHLLSNYHTSYQTDSSFNHIRTEQTSQPSSTYREQSSHPTIFHLE